MLKTCKMTLLFNLHNFFKLYKKDILAPPFKKGGFFKLYKKEILAPPFLKGGNKIEKDLKLF